MSVRHIIFSSLIAGLLAVPCANAAGSGDWKQGRVYYRMVCNDCHQTKIGHTIAPSTMTIAAWQAYIQADKHAKGKDSLKYYWSKAYRDSIKATNKAAAKYATMPDEDLMNNIKAFVSKGAKDGDSPASCS